MNDTTGGFIWYELATSDADAAAAFYGDVIGWTIGANTMPQAGLDYRMIERTDPDGSGGHAGGLLVLTDEMIGQGAEPGWTGYIEVADVDAEAARIEAEGGRTLLPATTMDGVGRFAMVADPQGNVFYLIAPEPFEGDPKANGEVFTVDQPQTVRWNELVTPDDDAAVAFYTGHFGWTQQGAMPMGPLGDYRFLQLGDVTIGAVMRRAKDMPMSGWSYYFGVDDIDRAVGAIGAGGGRMIGEPQQIPGGEYAVQAIDPQGAAFGLVGPHA